MYGSNLYGQTGYGIDENTETSEGSFIDLMAYLPEYYQNAKEMKELQTVLGYEVGAVEYGVEDILKQRFISTATWGLDRWEETFNLSTDKSKSYARRREILKAKLRGTGTVTKKMIGNVAVAFSGGEVKVIEYPQEYRFVVQFVGIKGIPQNMYGLIAALEEIKPSHLAYSFQYTYTVWKQLSTTWENAGQKTWDDLRIYEGE